MKSFKIGGTKSASPSQLTKSDAPRPSTSASSAAKPAAKPDALKDGFDTRGAQATPSGTKSTRGLFGKPAQQPGKDVTPSFTSNPLNFAGQNVLNSYNMFPGSSPQGVALPTPHKPFVPANQSVVTLNVHQHQGNSNLSVTAPGGNGAQAHYLHYLSTGTGRFAGIEGVPLHPRPGDPSMVVTGPLNGCAVHALHNTSNDTLSFVHHADFSKNGAAELKDFMAENPALRLVGGLKPSDYSHPTGVGRVETGATPFIHYNKPPGQNLGQWTLVGQLNDWKNGGGSGSRPELVRPQNVPTPWVHTVPIDTHQPVDLSTAH
jgi:hypothetical protein